MKLGALKRVPLREVWKNEEYDFSKWLATKDGMALLSEAVGIDIEPVETESNVGKFQLDILAKISGSEQTVVIENQIEDSNHDHLGKLVTYAAGKNATCAIWIVKNARDEHRRAVEFLNATSKSSIGYFLLEIEAWKIGDSEPAPKFNVVESPNDWARTEDDDSLTDTAKLCLRFWTEFGQYAMKQSSFTSCLKVRKPLPQNWMDFSVGNSALWLSASASAYHKAIRVSACLSPKYELRDLMVEKVPELSKALGSEIEVGSGQIKTLKISRSFDMTDESRWEEAFKWYCEMLVKYKGLLLDIGRVVMR